MTYSKSLKINTLKSGYFTFCGIAAFKIICSLWKHTLSPAITQPRGRGVSPRRRGLAATAVSVIILQVCRRCENRRRGTVAAVTKHAGLFAVGDNPLSQGGSTKAPLIARLCILS